MKNRTFLMANIIRIRNLTPETNLTGNEFIAIDSIDYTENAKVITIENLAKFVVSSGDTVNFIEFEEQDGLIKLDGIFSGGTVEGMWVTNIYFTGMTSIKSFDSPVVDGCILVYSAVTSSSGFWYPTQFAGKTEDVAVDFGGSENRVLHFVNGLYTGFTDY